MTFTKPIKLLTTATIAVAFASGAALAGDKKDCPDKDHTAMMKTEASQATAVLPASTERAAAPATTKMKVYTFDEAMEKCQKYGAKDLQACIDKKTGKTAAPKT